MDPKQNNKSKIIILGLLVHILLLLAVFDVYFSSPLDHGMTPLKSTDSPPAKRLVLFVADGLRAEAVYQKEEDIRIPFLSQIKKTGSWGVAHTRVPTESRPGHVAILAGIYEDPSAILKGWKVNPVYFNSVISESSNAWCWGSPDIINLFNRDHSQTVHLYAYSSEIEDFGKNNTGLLDTWVYNKVEHFLKEKVEMCSDLNCDKYYGGGNLFFLHLLGIDTAGHGYKPHSKEYVSNIRLVDEIARNITELFKTTFKDDSTAFVFTADHGMTDWGSHGSGSGHETEVPIIAWGAGINKSGRRQDINQIDVAPLLSSLIGINIPINSLGILPSNYLDMQESDLSKVLLSNTLQLLNTFNVKRLRTESNAILYIPFEGLTTHSIDTKLVDFGKLKNNQQYKKLMKECMNFMHLLIQGINYYHNYYQYPILISVSLGFLEWIVFLSVSVMFSNNPSTSPKASSPSLFAVSILIVILLCFKQKFPITYYLYFVFPVIMFFMIENLNIRHVGGLPNVSLKQVITNVIFYLIGIELLAYGFFDRLAFTILLLLVGIWTFLSDSLNRSTSNKEKCVWTACSFILAVFPSLPVMKTEFNVPVYVCGTLGWILLFREMYLNKIKIYYSGEIGTTQYKPFYIQFFCLILAAIYVLLLENKVISNDSNIKYISWLILVIPILMVPLTSTFIAVRLIATFFAFAPFYLLVSPNYEVLFSVFYVALLCTWLLIESKSFQFGNVSNIVYYVKFENYKSKNKISPDIFRRAFLFMVFIFLGFFGTGNIASLNSFDPMWVRAFLTVFSPFKMTGLILLKLMVPFIFTCCIFRAINSVGKENVLNTFCIILIFSDLMVLQFLYLITNEGSWLEIGTSLSHFIIMEAFVTILLLLYGLAHVLTTVTY
ncbi:GPI ethanolamine phosphate transferase 1 isoform X1 [Anoplophora glabripennis]|uniref:GPI ethanolamine phosphate transferase 1 isoform X1 n=1 Tax=Anoplophora glabripennis TaxID=217634 RepID=UPI00087495A6|nr:GPI ethanolamine phosphate transferase 1 isoform X1 [Anoplophora glabripennis]XP_018577330.1 GPI ethanolamine phosphate transferase 1 isoform X1 [Anoplophora glabripennis]